MWFALALQVVQWGLSLSSMKSTGGNVTGEILSQVLQIRKAVEDLHIAISDLSLEINAVKNEIISSVHDESARNRADKIEASIEACLDTIERIVQLRNDYTDGLFDENTFQDRKIAEISRLALQIDQLERDRRVITSSFMGKEDVESLHQAWPVELRIRQYLELNERPEYFSKIILDQTKRDYVDALELSVNEIEDGSVGHRLASANVEQTEILRKLRMMHYYPSGKVRCAFIQQLVAGGVKGGYWQIVYGPKIYKQDFESVKDSRDLLGGDLFIPKSGVPAVSGQAYTLIQPAESEDITFTLMVGTLSLPLANCAALNNGFPKGSKSSIPKEALGDWGALDEIKAQKLLDKKHRPEFSSYFKNDLWYADQKKDFTRLDLEISRFNLWSIRREIFLTVLHRAAELKNDIKKVTYKA